MSRDTNLIIITGRLTRDPELKRTKTGIPVCSFSLACNDDKEKVNFFDCQSWEKTGEIIAEYCKKGKKILVTGRISQQRWDDDNGVKHQKNIINVNSFEFMGGSREDSAADRVQSAVNGTSVNNNDNPFSDE